MNRVTTHSATFAINQLMVKSITRQILQHAEGSLSSGKISDEACFEDCGTETSIARK